MAGSQHCQQEAESEYECELMIEALCRELDVVRVRCWEGAVQLEGCGTDL